jgi:DNA polymerase-3 subunit delta
MALWPAERLATALDLVIAAELECKTTGLPAEAVAARALMRIAHAARPAARARRPATAS